MRQIVLSRHVHGEELEISREEEIRRKEEVRRKDKEVQQREEAVRQEEDAVRPSRKEDVRMTVLAAQPSWEAGFRLSWEADVQPLQRDGREETGSP